MEVFSETNTKITELFKKLMEDISEIKTTISTAISTMMDKIDMRQPSSEGGRKNAMIHEGDTDEATNFEPTKTSQQNENTMEAILKFGWPLNKNLPNSTATNELIQDEYLPSTTINWILPLLKELSKYEIKEPSQFGLIQANQKRLFEEADKGGVFEQDSKRLLDMAQNLKISLWVYKKMKTFQIKTGQS